jgi:hypothetical protein
MCGSARKQPKNDSDEEFGDVILEVDEELEFAAGREGGGGGGGGGAKP